MPFDFSNARFAFLDLETTGLSPWFGDRICEVGIVLTEGKRIKSTYQQLVNPERPLSPAAASTNQSLTEASNFKLSKARNQIVATANYRHSSAGRQRV